MKAGAGRLARRLAGSASTRMVGLAGTALVSAALALSVCAPSVEAQGACPNEVLRAESKVDPVTGQPYSLALPECRAYELVSPAYKQSHDVGTVSGFFEPTAITAAPSGNAIYWESQGDFANPENYTLSNGPAEAYVSQWTTSGWQTSSVPAPQALILGSQAWEFADFSPDLLSSQIQCGPVSSTGAIGGVNNGLRCAVRREGGAWEATPAYTQVENKTNEGKADGYEGGSADHSRAFLQAPKPLIPGDFPGAEEASAAMYEVQPVGPQAQLRFVNVGREDGNAGKPSLLVNRIDVGRPTSERLYPPLLGGLGVSERALGTQYHAVSESGQTVFFTAMPEHTKFLGGSSAVEQVVFARTPCKAELALPCEGRPEKSEELASLCKAQEVAECRQTIKVSDPNAKEGCTVCNTIESTEHPRPLSVFRGAAADGSKVFFTIGTEEQEPEIKPPLGGDATENLYMYDLNPTPDLPVYMNGQHLVNLTAGADKIGKKQARVTAVVRSSSDGSHVYIIALGVLTEQPNLEGQVAKEGEKNLYGVDTETGEVKFIAVAPGIGSKSMPLPAEGQRGEDHAQTTPDGRYLVFDSFAKLAGAANCPESVCHEAIYLYDFQTGQLTWLSHPAAGFGGAGNAQNQDAWVSERREYRTGAYADTNDFARAITGCPAEAASQSSGCASPGEHDGEDVIFATAQHLQGGAEGTTPQLYLWHCPATPGHEPCPNPGAEGEVRLISDGRSSTELAKAPRGGQATSSAISASGSDIFFLSATPLVGQDTDQLYDYYDARIDGGYPAPVAEPGCAGEGCQPTPPPVGSFGAAASSLIAAGGNLPPPLASVLTFHASKPKPLTRAQKLTRALQTCRKKDRRQRRRRAACERQARALYAPHAKAKRRP